MQNKKEQSKKRKKSKGPKDSASSTGSVTRTPSGTVEENTEEQAP
ncbi:MAG: hypothetical protein ACXVCP_12065 [Bdellovibrio sp.]